MKSFKSIFILTLFVIGLLAANLSLRFGHGEVKASDRRQLVETTEGLCGVRLEKDGAPTVELRKSGLGWRIASPYRGTVDEQAMMRFLDVLSMEPITDVIHDSSLLKLGRTRADFALAVPSTRLLLAFENGSSEQIGFGAETPLSGGVYVTINDMPSIFVVSSNILATVDVGADAFRRRALFTIGPDAVSSFAIKHQTGAPLEFVRGDDGWRVRNVSVSSQKVAKFLSSVTAAEAQSFVWPVGASNETEHASAALLAGYGLDPDSAVTVVLKGVDGNDHRVTFGKEGGKDGVYALIHGGTAIVMVPSELKALADQGESVFTDSRFFPVDARSVATFSLVDRTVQYAFVRDKSGDWFFESPIVADADDAAVNALLSRVLSLSMADAVPPGAGVEVSLSTNVEKSVVSRASVFGRLAPEDLRSKDVLRIDPVQVRRLV